VTFGRLARGAALRCTATLRLAEGAVARGKLVPALLRGVGVTGCCVTGCLTVSGREATVRLALVRGVAAVAAVRFLFCTDGATFRRFSVVSLAARFELLAGARLVGAGATAGTFG
jgi:hypothetical protein